MRKAVVVLLSVLALVLGLTSYADAAKAPYKVSLVTSVAKSSAGSFIAVYGHVTGPKAAGKSVTIQRHYAGGPWVTVATATVNSHGGYRARVETPRGGTTSFRAIKGRSSVRSAGVSPTRSIPVYEWLDLASQSVYANNTQYRTNVVWPIDGTTYSHTLIFIADSNVDYKLGGLCTTLKTIGDYQYSSSPEPDASVDLSIGVQPTTGSATYHNTQLNTGPATPLTVSLTGAKFLQFAVSNFDSSYGLVLADPKVYCNADQLPSWSPIDFA